MATSPTHSTQFVKSKKGKKPIRMVPYQKKLPYRGLGMAHLEYQPMMIEMREKMTETPTLFPSFPAGTSNNVPVLHGVASNGVPSYGFPMMRHDTAGFVIKRGAGNGLFSGLNGQFFFGAPETVQKEHCNGENVRINGGFNQFGQVLPMEGTRQNCNAEMNGFTTRAARSAAAYAGDIEKNETVMVAIHLKENGSLLIEYDFFSGTSGRSTSSKDREMPAEASVEVGVDLSLKL